jgi:hypothetical protein
MEQDPQVEVVAILENGLLCRGGLSASMESRRWSAIQYARTATKVKLGRTHILMRDEGMTKGEALLMMGCPDVPIQMTMALCLSSKLSKAGYDATVAGTDAALKLLKVSDIDSYYVKNTIGWTG